VKAVSPNRAPLGKRPLNPGSGMKTSSRPRTSTSVLLPASVTCQHVTETAPSTPRLARNIALGLATQTIVRPPPVPAGPIAPGLSKVLGTITDWVTATRAIVTSLAVPGVAHGHPSKITAGMRTAWVSPLTRATPSSEISGMTEATAAVHEIAGMTEATAAVHEVAWMTETTAAVQGIAATRRTAGSPSFDRDDRKPR
jgi:hypothetical protein